MEYRLPRFHVLGIGGYSQEHRKFNGIVDLWAKKLWDPIKGNGIYLHPPDTWHIDVKHKAFLLSLAGIERTEVFIIAYSYGGEKARRLAKALDERGIKVRFLFLIDPVRRWDLLPGVAAFLGGFPGFEKIPFLGRVFRWVGRKFRELTPMEIPGNVVEVWHYTQTRSWPYGWPVRQRFETITKLTSVNLNCGHVDADDSPVVHAHVLRAILSWIRETETNAAPLATEPDTSPLAG